MEAAIRQFFEPAEAPFWLKSTLYSIREALSDIWNTALRLKDYTTAGLPTAADWTQGLVYDSTLPAVKYSDGTTWQRLMIHNGGAALTRVDDTNVTLTLGGSPSTALLAVTSITVGWAGQLGVARGGTNIASYAVGDILYASGATTLAKLADVATGNALISGGVGIAPSWGKIGLTTHISGTLAVGNGGTGTTTSTGTGSVVLSAGPTLTGTLAAAAATFSGTVRVNGATGGQFGVVGSIYANPAATDTVFNGTVGTANAAFIGPSGYWAIRSAVDNSFNLDVFNAGSPIAALTVLQSGAASFAGALSAATWLKSGSYTVAGVPSAATAGAGAMIYVSNETGGAVPAFSDGTNWRRVTDRAIVA